MILTNAKSLVRKVTGFSEKVNQDEINYETVIKGTTLDVYFFLLRKKAAAGVREIQRALGLSSPSVSAYHLDKLETLGVVRKNRFGNYEISKKIDIATLNQFILVGNFALPRFLFYAVFVSMLFGGYILLFLTVPISTGEVFALLFGFVSTVICWIETGLSWRNKPF
ncbi:MAG: winged helix-turn-helix domain-containing protein [Candidatus Heimdallarchaeota archaeon]